MHTPLRFSVRCHPCTASRGFVTSVWTALLCNLCQNNRSLWRWIEVVQKGLMFESWMENCNSGFRKYYLSISYVSIGPSDTENVEKSNIDGRLFLSVSWVINVFYYKPKPVVMDVPDWKQWDGSAVVVQGLNSCQNCCCYILRKNIFKSTFLV